MNKYNPDTPCLKCGDTNADSKFCREYEFDDNMKPARGPHGGLIWHEWISRVCSRCSFSWTELCLDHVEEKK